MRGSAIWRGGLLHEEQDRQREHGPPHGHAEERESSALGEAKLEDHDDVDCQQQATAEIAQRIAPRRNPILIFWPGDMGQQCIVKGIGCGEADARNVLTSASVKVAVLALVCSTSKPSSGLISGG